MTLCFCILGLESHTGLGQLTYWDLPWVPEDVAIGDIDLDGIPDMVLAGDQILRVQPMKPDLPATERVAGADLYDVHIAPLSDDATGPSVFVQDRQSYALRVLSPE